MLSEDDVTSDEGGSDGSSSGSDADDSDGDVGGRRAGGVATAATGRYPYNVARQGPHGPRKHRRRQGNGDGSDADAGATDAPPPSSSAAPTAAASSSSKASRRYDRRGRRNKHFADSILGGGGSSSAAASSGSSRRKEKAKRGPNPQPLDYRRAFAGNVDDDFRLGIAVKRREVKLFADFNDSDILVASPLGLRRLIGGDGEKKKRELDFLSSIEGA